MKMSAYKKVKFEHGKDKPKLIDVMGRKSPKPANPKAFERVRK